MLPLPFMHEEVDADDGPLLLLAQPAAAPDSTLSGASTRGVQRSFSTTTQAAACAGGCCVPWVPTWGKGWPFAAACWCSSDLASPSATGPISAMGAPSISPRPYASATMYSWP